MSGDHGHEHPTDDHEHTAHDGHAHDHTDASRRALLVALGINTAFFLVELVGALLADSLTLLADATHMLTDSASLLLALFAAWVSTRPPDARRTYGYHRAEVLGALANGVFLLAVVGYILTDAVKRFGDPQPVDAPLVVVVGVVGLAANLAAAWVLSGYRDSLNVEGAFLHLLADAAGSVAAIVLGLALLVTDWYVLDPLFAVLVAALDSRRVALSAHLVTESEADTDVVLSRAQALLGTEFGIDHATLQLEGAHVETADFDCFPGHSEDRTETN